ncbi:MAG TPA: hypothetical protein ENK18_13300 [Deltaproteobacteria bacterium]|nr:hypothetical protein [Deltaproteobacteria bacterium]
MTRTLRRLARIQRIRQDEARNDLLVAQQAQIAHDEVLERCQARIAEAAAARTDNADELMRRHAFSLRQEMERRRLVAQAEHLEARVDRQRGQLMEAAKQVQTTERFTDRLEEIAASLDERRTQRVLDEAGLMVWMRRAGAVS